MKNAVQPISKEYSALDCNIVANPRNWLLDLADDNRQPIPRVTGETVQWKWKYNFSVTIPGVFGSVSIAAAQQDDGLYWTPELLVTGPAGTRALCEYKPLVDPGDNPQPAPPPNVIIVDNSGADNGAKRKGAINVVRGH